MRIRAQVVGVVAFLVLAAYGRSAEVPKNGSRPDQDSESQVNKLIENYANSGVDGVIDYTMAKGGVIEKVVVIGTARLSTVLGAADGLLEARREARLAAAGKFRQWLKEKVTIYEKSESERIIVLEGKEGDGQESLNESGKKISKNSTKYESYAEGIVRGLQVLGYKTISPNKKEKIYVVVLGFDARTADSTKKLAQDLDSDTPQGDGSGKVSESPAGGDVTREKKKIGDQSGVSPGAKKFFDK